MNPIRWWRWWRARRARKVVERIDRCAATNEPTGLGMRQFYRAPATEVTTAGGPVTPLTPLHEEPTWAWTSGPGGTSKAEPLLKPEVLARRWAVFPPRGPILRVPQMTRANAWTVAIQEGNDRYGEMFRAKTRTNKIRALKRRGWRVEKVSVVRGWPE